MSETPTDPVVPQTPRYGAPAVMVAAPDRTVPNYGLFTALTFLQDPRLVLGIEVEGVECGPPPIIATDDRCTSEWPDLVEMAQEAQNRPETASSFTAYGFYTCALPGRSRGDSANKAEAHLLGGEQTAAEQWLWEYLGTRTDAENLGTEAEIENAIAKLEQHLAFEYGGGGVIHLSRENALKAFKVLEVSGGVLRTKLGTKVVAGAGYGPSTLYGTAALVGWRSDVYLSETDFFDLGKNVEKAIAARDYSLAFEDCGLSSVTIG